MIIFFFYIFDEDANTTVPVEIDNEYNEELEFFFDDKIRKIWHKQEQEWYFSILDVILYLTESSDPKQYLKKMKHRDPELSSKWGTICTPAHRRKSGCVCDNCVDNDSSAPELWHCP